jgi:uncharacterized protein YaiE (UPF0345 family)
VPSASADTLQVTESGTFASNTPTTTESKANENFSFSFDVSSTPTVISHGQYDFVTSFSNFTYTLNGKTVAVTPTSLTWNAAQDGGLFDIDFNGVEFELSGSQLYTGSVTKPTIDTGTYNLASGSLFVDGCDPVKLSGNVVITDPSKTSATPEPSSLFLLGTGLAGLGGMLKRKYRAATSA